MTDPRTEAILQNYRKEVEKLARNVYLQAIALKNELNSAKINPARRVAEVGHPARGLRESISLSPERLWSCIVSASFCISRHLNF